LLRGGGPGLETRGRQADRGRPDPPPGRGHGVTRPIGAPLAEPFLARPLHFSGLMELVVWGEMRWREGLAPLAGEFPAVRITGGEGEMPAGALHAEQWEAPGFDFWGFDRELDALAEEGRPLPGAADARPFR